MRSTIPTSKFLLAVAVGAFGIEQFIFRHPLTAFIPMASTASSQSAVAYITGVLFIAAAIRIILNTGGKYTAWFPCTLFFLLFLLLHLPSLMSNLSNGGEWTVCFELMAIASGCLLAVVLGPALPAGKPGYHTWLTIAKILFALSLIVFSALHFIYAAYIATLIPKWIPFPLFWSYFFGVAFLAAAISILLNRLVRLSASLLAVVFFMWVLVLHLPRCINNAQTEAEWTSMFVALSMGAIALLFAATSWRKQPIMGQEIS